MRSKHRIVFLLGKADGYLERAMDLTSVAAAGPLIAKAMDIVAFSAGMADEGAFWKSQQETAVALRAVSMSLLATVQSLIYIEDPEGFKWTEDMAKIRTDIQALALRGKFR